MQWLGLEAQNFEYGGQGSDLTGSKRTSVRGGLRSNCDFCDGNARTNLNRPGSTGGLSV
jgi:hypothetical protein